MSNKLLIILVTILTWEVSFTVAGLAAPNQPSVVYTAGRQLIIERRLADGSLAEAKPYIIKGLTWQPATQAPAQGPNPINPSQTVQYGFFFDWQGRIPQGHEVLNYWLRSEFSAHYLNDIALMGQMNVNTVRVYTDFGQESEVYNLILDQLYEHDIMAIITIAISKQDIETGRYLDLVQLYKNHPAVLMWSLGNEWNLDYNKYYGYNSVAEAAEATNQAAEAIKAVDLQHPVSSCLGDRFSDPEYTNTIDWIVNQGAPNVDLWGINVYRGASFYNLFEQWQGLLSSKPFYLSEFGTDSFQTSFFIPVNGYQADECQGAEDQVLQAEFAIGLWAEIKAHLSAFDSNDSDPAKSCLGGLVHEFNDELWKVGCWHAGLGALVDYDGADNLPDTEDDDTSYDEYNSEGFILPGHPDGVANEEYFGVVDAQRNPKQAFRALQHYYQDLDSNHPPQWLRLPQDRIFYVKKPGCFWIKAKDPEQTRITYEIDNAPDTARFKTHHRAARFCWKPGAEDLGIHSITFSARDQQGSTIEKVIAITVLSRSRPRWFWRPFFKRRVRVGKTWPRK